MDLHSLDIFMKVAVFLLAISVHESAHAWTAGRYGDPTATLLGRVSLNPIRHIDPVGTVLLPAIGIISGFGAFGWAKPTPVDPRNFKEPMKADIMTSVAGPASNFILVAIAFGIAAAILAIAPAGHDNLVLAVEQMFQKESVSVPGGLSVLFPVMLFLMEMIFINVLLGIFNLVPLPPLDGSHVVRHVMPEEMRKAYDTIGMIGLFAFVIWGGRILGMLISPVLGILFGMLGRIHG
ncbi:MAG: site-2 protease family protein [Candidatus Koribacter versatilis]|uniref:Site-2 protease family protein n=1 Tax=Candidatus Korobacter versatilis TaxID=658062 RepID=A0A932AA05_9BACT|nr:site-2 protease family protein [Candidatus Koribacter versatilis]